MRAIVVGRYVRVVRVDRIVGSREIHISGPCVMGQYLQAMRESFLHLYLKRLVIVAGVTREIAQVLTPAEFSKERLALICGEDAEAGQSRLVGILISTGAGENIRSLIADVSGFDRDGIRHLPVHREIPDVNGR